MEKVKGEKKCQQWFSKKQATPEDNEYLSDQQIFMEKVLGKASPDGILGEEHVEI